MAKRPVEPQELPPLSSVVKQTKSAPVFLAGVTKVSQAEQLNLGERPRFAFAGRSNVGKSSLLNALTGARIARVSQEPGRTREINFFAWHGRVLVDLPGYGFARVSKSLRDQWGQEIPKILGGDPHLRLVLCLVDGRHGFTALDLELVRFLQEQQVPYLVAFTKMDKYKSANQRRTAERELTAQAQAQRVADFVFCSSQQAGGVAQLKKLILESK